PESQHLTAPGEDRGSKRDLVQRNSCLSSNHHTMVTSECHHAPAGDGVTVERSHNRFWISEDICIQGRERADEVGELFPREGQELGNIETEREEFAAPREDNRTNLRIDAADLDGLR